MGKTHKKNIHLYLDPKEDKDLIDWLAASNNQSNTIADIIRRYHRNELIEITTIEVAKEIKTKKAMLEIKKLEKQVEKLDYDTKISKAKAIYWETFTSPPSPSATKAIHDAHSTSKQILADDTAEASPVDIKNKRLICVDCGVLFETGDIAKDYHNHIAARHDRYLTTEEKKALDSLGYRI